MRIRNHINRVFIWLFALVTCTPASAQVGLSWHTIDGGGAIRTTGGNFELSGTFGQPDAGSFTTPMTGGGFELVGGFWPAARTVCTLPGDINLDGRRDGRDVLGFVNCMRGSGGTQCSCADVDASGTVTHADVAAFVHLLLSP